jgi:tight adherence protein B
MDPNLVFVLVAVLGFIAVAGVGFVFVGGDSAQVKAAKRVQAITTQGKAGEKRARMAPAEAASLRRKQILENLKANDKQQRRTRLTVESRLRQAGLSLTKRQFWIYSAILAVTVGALAAVMMRSLPIGLGLAFASGLGLPRWVLSGMAKGRLKKFTQSFPDAIDIIVRGIKSGLPVHDCLKVIARESPEPVGSEFTRMVEGLGLGQTMDQALERVYERMPTPELRFFAIVMAIQQKTGGNLAEALGGLSAVLRARRLMREKVKAMSGEAVASAFIIGSLPPGIMILVSITSPSYMAPMYNDPRGHLMLLGSALWMACGIFSMRKMINFKI